MKALAWLRMRWPELRAALLLLHVVAVVLLSFPASPKLVERARWEDQRGRGEIVLWAQRFQRLGIETTPAELDAQLWSVAQGYIDARRAWGVPLRPYTALGGVGQSWGMFKSPQRRPGELVVKIRDRRRWQVVYVSRSREHDYLARELDNNRMRKLVARAVFEAATFEHIARWIARRAAADFPKASDVAVEMVRFDSLPAERVRAGEEPQKSAERKLRLALEKFR